MATRLAAGMVVAAFFLDLPAARAEDAGTAAVVPASPQDPAGQAIAEARDTFRLGVDLAKNGRWDDALAAFERSHRLRPHVVTAYNIGFCQKALGRFTAARRTLTDALAANDTRAPTSLPQPLAVKAQVLLDEIERRLAVLDATMQIANAKLLVDGRPLERRDVPRARTTFTAGTRDFGPPEGVPSGPFSIDMDPGTHLFQIIHDDRVEPEIVKTVSSGQVLRMTFAEKPPSRPIAAAPARPRWPAYVAFGIGAAGVTTLAVFGTLALEKRSELTAACPGYHCPPSRSGELDRFRTYADVATAGLVVGLAGTITGGYLWFRSREEGASGVATRRASSRVRPAVGLRSVGVEGEF